MHPFMFLYRDFRNWESEKVANELDISLDRYKDLETGQEVIDAETSTKLSTLYNAPPQIFLAKNAASNTSILYTHCTFQDSFGYVNHNYQNDFYTNSIEKLIFDLKNEIKKLRSQNNELVNEIIKINKIKLKD